MLKKVLRLLFVFACVIASGVTQAFYSLNSNVLAVEPGDIVLQINPAEQTLDLYPGMTFTGTLKVKNIGRLPFNFNLLSRPYQVKNESYDPDFVTENSYTKLHNWLSFPETNFHLEPNEEITVLFNVTVPDDVPGGGQYAAIIVETRDSADENATVRVVSQVAGLLYAHVAGEEHIGGVLMQHSLPSFLLGSPFTASATVKNDGNLDFRIRHTLSIKDFFTGNEVLSPETIDPNGDTPGLATPVVLPATSRSNSLTWTGAPQLGVFKAVQTVSFLDQEYTFEQIVFICPIWLAGGLLFLVILMIIWLILRHRKAKQSRPQAF